MAENETFYAAVNANVFVKEIKVRARYLNDFKKYLKIVNANDRNFNFTEYFESLAGAYNIYSMVFTMEILLSLLVTVTTAINLLKDTVINAFKLINVNRSNNIDIILGDNEIELNYAKTSSNAIVWLNDASRSKVNDLIEEGYTVINKKLTVDVLKSKLFNKFERLDVEKTIEKILKNVNFNNASSEDIMTLINFIKEETGIKTLKIGYNRIFGYYIEVSKGQIKEIKEDADLYHLI